MSSLVSPQLAEACIPAATLPISGIVRWIFLIEILVIFLGNPECAFGQTLCDHGLSQLCGRLRGALGCELNFIGVICEDGGSVLIAPIAELPIGLCGINVVPEHGQ